MRRSAVVFCTDSRCTERDVRRFANVFCTYSRLQDVMSDLMPMFSAQTVDVENVTSDVPMFSAQTVDYRT